MTLSQQNDVVPYVFVIFPFSIRLSASILASVCEWYTENMWLRYTMVKVENTGQILAGQDLTNMLVKGWSRIGQMLVKS